MKQGRARVYVAVAMGLLCIAAIASWQRQTLARLAIAAAAASFAQMRVSFGSMHLTTQQAAFENVRVTSLGDEPIATIARLSLTYDLRDLLPGGKRLYGLKSVTVDSPDVTIVRHADGSFNVPQLQPPANNGRAQTPLILRAVVRNGSIEVVNESPYAKPSDRRMYVRDIDADAGIASSEHSQYVIAMRYGERLERLYPVRGRGEIDLQRGYIDQRWKAAELPVTAAANFVINSPSLRLDSGMLQSVDARYFALGAPGGTLTPHFAAGATLTGASLSVAGSLAAGHGRARPARRLRERFADAGADCERWWCSRAYQRRNLRRARPARAHCDPRRRRSRAVARGLRAGRAPSDARAARVRASRRRNCERNR